MAPQESNEEAMRRLIAKGKGRDSHQRHGNAGKGKGGKGVKGGCPPSSDEIPEARREELCAELEEFVASESKQLQMPTSITGLERKFLHEQAELRSLTTQSFGQGRERYLCIFKQEQAVIEEAAPASAAVGKVSYSAVFLDEESRKKLFDFCGRTIAGGIPARWKMYGDHMTICLGPLSDPTTEDFRSVAETVQKQISRYQEQQRFELQVVSLGHNDDAIAVGVIGCTSCNRNPHITVATAPQIPPNASNMIKKWTMLPSTEQLTLVGHLKQLGAGDARAQRAAPAAAAGAPEAEPAAEVEAEVTEESFASHSWHGRRFKLGCVDGSDAVDWFGVGPPPGYSTRGDLLDREDVPDSQALMLGFSKEEAPTFIFEELGQTKGGDVVNPLTLPGGVTVPQAYVYTFRLAEGPPCYVSEHDEGPGPEYFVADLAPSHSRFAFLPLEGNTRSPKTKVSGAEKDEKDCCYGMYHMEKKQGQDYYTYWMDGDYPVYIITDQLCRASDECYPPTRYKVWWDPEFVLRVIEVDIESDEGTSAWRLVARSLAGDVVAELKVRRKTKLGELRAQLREAMPASSVHATISLVNAKSKSLLQPSDDSKTILSLM